MSDAERPSPGGFSIDLSTQARTGKRPRKGPPAVVTQTINLSTPKPRPETPPSAPPPAPKPSRQRPRTPPADGPRGGHGLADLLDEATLARLRGLG